MKFFVPGYTKGKAEAGYNDLLEHIKDQLRTPITPRRIFSISYTHDKKPYHIEVGKFEQQENRYEVVAIFESSVFIAMTRNKTGVQGIKILVSKDEVTDVKDFD